MTVQDPATPPVGKSLSFEKSESAEDDLGVQSTEEFGIATPRGNTAPLPPESTAKSNGSPEDTTKFHSEVDDDYDLLAMDKVLMAKAIMGHDMTECVGAVELARSVGRYKDLLKVDVMEVYSPERVTKLCEKHGLRPGCSLDLTNEYDFDKATDRQKACNILKRDEPLLLIGSPPCTYFSVLNELNKTMNKSNPEWI